MFYIDLNHFFLWNFSLTLGMSSDINRTSQCRLGVYHQTSALWYSIRQWPPPSCPLEPNHLLLAPSAPLLGTGGDVTWTMRQGRSSSTTLPPPAPASLDAPPPASMAMAAGTATTPTLSAPMHKTLSPSPPLDVVPLFRFGGRERSDDLFGHTAGLIALGRDEPSLCLANNSKIQLPPQAYSILRSTFWQTTAAYTPTLPILNLPERLQRQRDHPDGGATPESYGPTDTLEAAAILSGASASQGMPRIAFAANGA